jgi:hypothetical protein
MKTTIEMPPRKKDHKGGKILSLTIIWAGIALVVILAVIQIIAMLTSTAQRRHNRDLTAATSMTKSLQPMSTKIVASDSETAISMGDATPEDYSEVWDALDHLAPDNATQADRDKIIMDFLAGLDYTARSIRGVIISKSSGNVVSVATIMCYLNGYIPDKPYLKPNCPAY